MAITFTCNRSILADAEAVCDTTPGGTWSSLGSGAGFGTCADVVRVGTNSLGKRLSNARGGAQFARTCTIDFCCCGTRAGVIGWWNQLNGIASNTNCCAGMCIGGWTARVGSASTAYGEWKIVRGDEYPGGWQYFTLDLSVAPCSTTGSPCWNAVDYFATQADQTTTFMGNVNAYWIDEVRFLTAAQVLMCGTASGTITGTVATAGALWCEAFSAAGNCTAGVLTKAGGAINLNQSVDIGGAAAVGTFTSQNELVTVGPLSVTSAGRIFIRFLGNMCNVQTHRFGTETGCGMCSIGSGGGVIKGVKCNTFNIIATCCELDVVEAFGVLWCNVDFIDWTDTVDKMVSSTIANVRKIDFGCGAEIRDGVITCGTETCAAIGTFEFLTAAGPTCPEFRDMLLQNHTSAMEWSLNGCNTLCLRNITYAGNTNDLRFNHSSGNLTVAVLECGDTPSTSDGGAGGTITVTNNVCLVVTVLDVCGNGVEGARVGIFDAPVCIGECPLYCGTTNCMGVFTVSHNLMCDVTVETRVRLKGYIATTTAGTINMCGLCVPVTFIQDNIVDLP